MSWLAIASCWIISFLFSGIEAGLLSVDPIRLRHQVNQRRRAALRLNRLIQRPQRLLITVLLVTNLADISALLLLTRILVMRFGVAGFGVAVLIALPVYLFVLAIFPKSLFRRFPFRALAAIGGLLDLATTILSPILAIGERVGRLLVPNAIAERPRLFAAREELKDIAVQSEREGSLTATERAMIHNVVDFRNVRARDVMVPITKSVVVSPDVSVAEAVKLSATTGIDRLPVVAEGRAVGLVNVLDMLLDDGGSHPVQRQMRRIVTAPAREPAYRLIRRLRAARLGLAAVIDADHKLTGIVTLEDLIQRLVSIAPPQR